MTTNVLSTSVVKNDLTLIFYSFLLFCYLLAEVSEIKMGVDECAACLTCTVSVLTLGANLSSFMFSITFLFYEMLC